MLDRRSFLIGTAGTAGATLWSRSAFAANPDVVVIGAGAAGLATALELAQRGLSVTLIEARGRIGGRAYTESETFGVPYDQGCHWLHSASQNPWVKYGQENGFTLYPASDDETLYVGDQEADAAAYAAAGAQYRDVYNAIGAAGRAGTDISAAEAANPQGPWATYAAASIGQWSMGKDLDGFSATDWWSGSGGADWFCKEGFGALIAHYGRDIPVSLDTAATRIRWDGPGVVVETTQGDIAARAAVVTVSTGVLAAEKIAFAPALPDDKRESFERVSMGTYNHIALMFSKDVFGIGDDGYFAYQSDSDRIMGVLANISGTGLAFGYVGGRFGRELEKAGVEAAVDYGLGELRAALGSDVDTHFVKGNYTRWGEDQWTLGAYASAEPGYKHMRGTLRAPVGDRIFFAGEACHGSMWATAAGAHLSGKDAALQVAGVLG